MANYTEDDENELNKYLKRLQKRASKLILCDYYDHINLSELQYTTLKAITNANTHRDINWYLWNSGMLEKTLDSIAAKIKEAKK